MQLHNIQFISNENTDHWQYTIVQNICSHTNGLAGKHKNGDRGRERHVPFFATYYVTYSDDTEEKKEDEEEEEENRANNLLFVQIVGRFYAVTLLKWAFHRT